MGIAPSSRMDRRLPLINSYPERHESHPCLPLLDPLPRRPDHDGREPGRQRLGDKAAGTTVVPKAELISATPESQSRLQ